MRTTWTLALAVSGLVGLDGLAAETNLCPPRTQWDRSYGGTSWDYLEVLVATPDGGFVAAGNSRSLDGDRQAPRYGSSDAWVVRLNANGDLLWEHSFGGSDPESATSIVPTD